jgi:hypothetical protein
MGPIPDHPGSYWPADVIDADLKTTFSGSTNYLQGLAVQAVTCGGAIRR